MATRAQVDAILSGMLGARVTDRGGAIDGASPVSFWSFPILSGLRACGIIPENPISPTDSDTERVTDANWEKFIDFCHLRGLIAISSMAPMVLQYSLSDYSERKQDDIFSVIDIEKKRVYEKWGKPETESNGITVGMIAVRSGRRESSSEI